MTDAPANHFGKPTPVFYVKDVEASIRYYVDVLGFRLNFRGGEWFASVSRDDCTLFLTADRQSQPRMWVYIGIEDVRALHDQCVNKGATIRNPPNNFEWAIEMQVEDLDGNVLRLGSEPERNQPLGIWRDADGVRWQHLGDEKYERLD